MRTDFTINDLLRRQVEERPTAAAVISHGLTLTYAGLYTRVCHAAAALQGSGVSPEDRIGIQANRLDTIIWMMATSLVGGVFVNINEVLTAEQVAHITADCDIFVMVTNKPIINAHYMQVPPDGSEIVNDGRFTPVPLSENSLATLIYTSGSTGWPKGVMLTHRNLLVGAQIVSGYLENTQYDRVLGVLPLSFDAGLSQWTTMLAVGGAYVIPRSNLPGDLRAAILNHGVTGITGVPHVWTLLLNAFGGQPTTPFLNYLANTGGKIPQQHLDRLRATFPITRIYLMYGLTEAFRSTYLPPKELWRGSSCIGKAIPNTEVWVVNDAGKECPPNVIGELVHHGPTLTLGYWGDAERTERVFRRNPFSPDGVMDRDIVVYSGDLVYRDEDDFLYHVGRVDEQIKSQGYRVSPTEIESALYDVLEVAEVVAFGVDGEGGQKIIAVMVGDVSSEEVLRKVRVKVPAYMVPSEVFFLDTLPTNANGKLDRKALREKYLAGGLCCA